MINKNELRYIIYAGIFALIWFAVIIPKVVGKMDGSMMQFFLFNIGLIIFLQIFLKAIVLKAKIGSTVGLVTMFVALDMITPPYAVSITGELLTGMALYSSASDYFFGSIGQGFGIGGFPLYLFTYLLIPVILLIISAKLIPNFVRKI